MLKSFLHIRLWTDFVIKNCMDANLMKTQFFHETIYELKYVYLMLIFVDKVDLKKAFNDILSWNVLVTFYIPV